MGHRIAKRVPLDFDAPLGQVWEGYLTPKRLRPTCCPTCGPDTRRNPFMPRSEHIGDGRSPAARAIADTFYGHSIDGPNAEKLAWHDKLGQAEVDLLVEKDRLREYRVTPEADRCGAPCDDAPEGAVWKGDPCGRIAGHDGEHHPRPGEWVRVPRTAAEVNAANARGGMFGDLHHDGINRCILIENRCKMLGIEEFCQTCSGEGSVYASDQQRAEAEAWEPSEPPTGEGWQLWETTTEGSPVSPVFATPEQLAEWCGEHATVFADMKQPAATWLSGFVNDTTDIDSMLFVRKGSPADDGATP